MTKKSNAPRRTAVKSAPSPGQRRTTSSARSDSDSASVRKSEVTRSLLGENKPRRQRRGAADKVREARELECAVPVRGRAGIAADAEPVTSRYPVISEENMQLVAAEYVKSKFSVKATAAAVRKSSGFIHNLLNNRPEMRAYIRQETARVIDETEMTAAEVLLEVRRCALANMADYTEPDDSGKRLRLNFQGCTRAHLAAIEKLDVEETWSGRGEDARPVIRTRFALAGKMKAAELLMRYFKILSSDHDPHNGGRPQQPPALNVHFVKGKV